MRAAILALSILSLAASALARDNGQWGHDESTSLWFKSLRDNHGVSCCDYADGTRIEDPGNYRENDDHSFDIDLGSETIHVPPEKVLKGSNRVGYAILWRLSTGTITCFLPGGKG